MKTAITPAYTFNPSLTGTGAKTLDLSAYTGFDIKRLLGVINATTGAILYAPGLTGFGYSALSGAILTLAAPMVGMAPSDKLLIWYDDPAAVIGKVGIQVGGSDVAAGSPVPTATKANAPRVTATGPLGALNAILALALDGMSTGLVQLSGTWVGQVAWQGSADGGTTYVPVNMIPYGGGASTGSATGNGLWETSCGGLTHLQAVMTAWTSGSATALLIGAHGQKSVRVGAPSANPVPVNPQSSTLTTDVPGTLAAAGTATPLAANASRQLLIITNTGAEPLGYRFDAAATAAASHIVGAGQTHRYDAKCPTGALNLFSANGTTYFVSAG